MQLNIKVMDNSWEKCVFNRYAFEDIYLDNLLPTSKHRAPTIVLEFEGFLANTFKFKLLFIACFVLCKYLVAMSN